MLNVLIMAGGSGQRFWPKSREKRPKQFLSIQGNKSMIQETVFRAKKLVDYAQIYIVTKQDYLPLIKEQLPDIMPENIIVEPEGRDTAPCIGLASLFIERRDADGLIAVLPSDHIIQNNEAFCSSLRLAAHLAENSGGTVTLGIRPQRAETAYGYLKLGEQLQTNDMVYKVERFIEKPEAELAKDFIESNSYLWNSGVFVWKIKTLRQLIEYAMPEMYEGLETIRASMESTDYPEICQREYVKFKKISIDYGLMEKAPSIYTVLAEMGWDDMGNWSTMKRFGPLDNEQNVIIGKVITKDSRNNIICGSDSLVAAIGVEGLIIVETDDCILVAAKERESEIRSVIEELKKRKWNEYI